MPSLFIGGALGRCIKVWSGLVVEDLNSETITNLRQPRDMNEGHIYPGLFVMVPILHGLPVVGLLIVHGWYSTRLMTAIAVMGADGC